MRQKLLVRAIGSIMLIEPVQQTVITSRRIHVVDDSYFVRYRAGKTVPAITPQLEVFDAPIKDSATDEELARFFKDSDGDENLAMNAFLSKYAEGVPDEETDEEREARVAREANQQSGAAFQTEPTTEGQQGATEGQQGTEGQGSGDGSQGAEGQGSGDGTTPPVEDATKTPVEGTTPPTEDAAKTTADAAKPAARRRG